jgi:hypothetical protein
LQIQNEGHYLQFGAKDALLNALLLAAKRFNSGPPPASIAIAINLATSNWFETTPFTAGPGASTGGVEIDEGEFARAPENAGGGEGGEFTVGKEGEWGLVQLLVLVGKGRRMERKEEK